MSDTCANLPHALRLIELAPLYRADNRLINTHWIHYWHTERSRARGSVCLNLMI